ncbi:MAG: hypothetical protein IKN79_12005 [Eubacterium sp.]|nr:hypothetical protein [Eubacterium sp.]
MALDDRLFRDMRRNEKKAAGQDLYYAEEPDWMIYEERERGESLNRFRGIYNVADERSINRAPSVFDKGTIFRTDENRKNG